jgi:hypothetical protein
VDRIFITASAARLQDLSSAAFGRTVLDSEGLTCTSICVSHSVCSFQDPSGPALAPDGIGSAEEVGQRTVITHHNLRLLRRRVLHVVAVVSGAAQDSQDTIRIS